MWPSKSVNFCAKPSVKDGGDKVVSIRAAVAADCVGRRRLSTLSGRLEISHQWASLRAVQGAHFSGGLITMRGLSRQ
jgi:hypothetical protein